MSTVVVADQVRIPSWVNDLESFSRWNWSNDYPERGWVSFLDGEIWVDTHMEQLFTHNRVKTCFTIALGGVAESEERGYSSDRAFLSNEGAQLATEPDDTFCSFAALDGKRVTLVEGVEEGHVEIEGTADMVLEVVSTRSVRKDTKVLRGLYWTAGVPEYWLVDARKGPVQFDLLRWTPRGYTATRGKQNWLKSKVFGRSFRLETKADRLGNPQFFLRVGKAEPPRPAE
jgi:Uma2 family endonuclease